MSAFAVMQDDSVLCAECVHEHQGEGLPVSAGTLVHAWLTVLAGEACGCCGATDDHEQEAAS